MADKKIKNTTATENTATKQAQAPKTETKQAQEVAQAIEKAEKGYNEFKLTIPTFKVIPAVENGAIVYGYASTKEQDGEKAVRLDKVTKNPESLAKLIQSKVLDTVYDNMQAIIDRMGEQEKKDELTDEEQATRNGAKATQKRIDALRKTYPSTAGTTDTALAELIACYIVRSPLKCECAPLLTAYSDINGALDDLILQAIKDKDGKAQLTEEQRGYITTFRQALKKTLAPYTAKSSFTEQFDLSISAEDVLMFYKAGQSALRLKDGKITTRMVYSTKDNKPAQAFYTLLATYLLGKMRILR